MSRSASRPYRSRVGRRGLAVATVALATLAVAVALPETGASAASTKITYTSKTVVVPTATVKKELLSVSADGSTYTFKSKTGVLTKLAKGKVMLLQDVAVRDVTSTAKSGAHFVVHSTPAQLSDLISNGTLAWNQSIDFAKGYAVGGTAVPPEPSADVAGLATQPNADVLSRFGLQSLASGGGFTLKGKTDSYSYSVEFKPSASSVAVTITISKDSPVELEAKITGTLDNLKTAGSMTMSKGKFSSAKVVANNLKGSFKLSYSAKPISAFGLGTAGGIKITLPAEIAVPFYVGGVPLFLGVKVAFFASAGFSGFGQEVAGSYTLNYNGSGGFSTSKSGATSLAGAVKGVGDVILGAANAVKTGPISFIFGAQMPELELGLGVKGLNVAGSITLLGSSGIATFGAGCDTRQLEIEGVAGASAKFFGFSASLGSATLFDKKIQASYPKGCGVFP